MLCAVVCVVHCGIMPGNALVILTPRIPHAGLLLTTRKRHGKSVLMVQFAVLCSGVCCAGFPR